MLRLEATDEEFSTFLRETCGIETNSFTVRQARNAAKGHADLWKDVCERWDREPKSLVELLVARIPADLPTYLPTSARRPSDLLPTYFRRISV